jgi:hypothetical protein
MEEDRKDAEGTPPPFCAKSAQSLEFTGDKVSKVLKRVKERSFFEKTG